MPVRTTHKARPRLLRRATNDIGPCQIDGCPNRARLVVEWTVDEYGTMRSWYCDEHAPEAGR